MMQQKGGEKQSHGMYWAGGSECLMPITEHPKDTLHFHRSQLCPHEPCASEESESGGAVSKQWRKIGMSISTS